MKKITVYLLALFYCIVPTIQNVVAQEQISSDNGVRVYIFWGQGCPHCKAEKEFLYKLQTKYPELEVLDYEIWYSEENRALLDQVGKKLQVDIRGVPFTVIGDQYVMGYYDEATTGKQIEEMIQGCERSGDPNTVGILLGESSNVQRQCEHPSDTGMPEKIHVPLFGDLAVRDLSLPIMTVVIGVLDGFNPCAMWTLIFLIGLLLGMQDKKRMWILGGAFIAASAGVYFLFLAAWLNLLLFLGFILWVRLGIGIVALGGGGYYLREYVVNKEGACKVTGGEKRKKIFQKLRDITHKQQFLFAFIGIILLAVAVNLVELICSAGLPAVYTQMLTLSHLPTWQYYLYLLLYIFFFMLDDLIVFFAAMITLQVTGLSSKYSRWSHLVGGIIMLFIGVLLILKPEWLMFG